MDIIRSLEALRAVEVLVKEKQSEKPRRRRAGRITSPSQELLDYAGKVREEWK